jgi:hypothetical protein
MLYIGKIGKLVLPRTSCLLFCHAIVQFSRHWFLIGHDIILTISRGFVVDSVTMEQVLFEVFGLPLLIIIPGMLHFRDEGMTCKQSAATKLILCLSFTADLGFICTLNNKVLFYC